MFRVGVVPGIIATIIFSVAPGVRFTELGIRGVERGVVEAGLAFGSSPGSILRKIQLPLAMPTIMAGINQVIMLALSMVVIAGMVGAGGLGGEVVASLNRIDAGLGFEAGLAVVILAIFLDRVTASVGKASQPGGRRAQRRAPSDRRSKACRTPEPRGPRPINVPADGHNERNNMKHYGELAAVTAVAALGLTACGGGGGEAGGQAASGLDNGDKQDVTIAVFNGWDEGIAASELWKAILEEKGYKVTLEYADPAPVFAGLSTGDYDLVRWIPGCRSRTKAIERVRRQDHRTGPVERRSQADHRGERGRSGRFARGPRSRRATFRQPSGRHRARRTA